MDLYSLSICTGVAGLDLGIELAAPGCFTPIALCEGEAYAAAILAARMEDKAIPSAPIWSDVRTLCNAEFSAYVRARTGGQGIDFVYGGIPCQPHSVAGKQLGADDPRDLWPDTVRILEKYKPWLFFMENVPGMLGDVSRRAIVDLRRLGYIVPRPVLLEAASVGSPQKRERLFLLAYHPKRRGRGVSESTQRHDTTDVDGRGATMANGESRLSRRTRKRRGASDDSLNSGDVANGDDSGQRASGKRESPARHAKSDGGRDVANSKHSTGSAEQRTGSRQRRGEGPKQEPMPCGACGTSGCTDLADSECPGEQRRRDARDMASPARTGGAIPYWPPGPADRAEWERIIAARPDLAPATQPGIRAMADGIPAGMGEPASTRVDELRALGNGVVPLAGAAAFLIMLDRLKEAMNGHST